MNKDTILKTVLPKWFELYHIKYPFKNVYVKYSDIPNKSFVYFDLIMNYRYAYDLIIQSINFADRTKNIDANSRSQYMFRNAIYSCMNSYEKEFPEERLQILEPFEMTQLFNLIWLNKERFV